MKTLFIAFLTLLPIAIDIGFISYGFIWDRSDVAFLALWGILIAIPASGVSYQIARISCRIYASIHGSSILKLATAGSFILVSYAACYIPIFLVKEKQDNSKTMTNAESANVETFVSRSDSIAALVGPIKKTSVVTLRRESTSLPTEYEVMVEGETTTFAIVTVSRKSNQPAFTIKCTTPLFSGHRDPRVAPCVN